MIQRELQLYKGTVTFPAADPAEKGTVPLTGKPRIVAANKVDALDDPDRLARLEKHLGARGIPLYKISGVTGEGISTLLEAMWSAVSQGSGGNADETPR